MGRRRHRRRSRRDTSAVAATGAVLAVVVLAHAPSLAVALLVVIAGTGAAVLTRRHISGRRRRIAAGSLAELRALDPVDFEHAVGELLGREGWHLAHVGRTGDDGADLIGTDPTGRRVVVQAKRYAGSVGAPIVRDLAGAVTLHRVDLGVLVTTGSLTTAGRETARRCGVLVIGPGELARLVHR